MAQIYRIYVNDKRIILTSDPKKAYHSDSKKITEKELHSVLAGMVNGNDSANFVLLTPAPGKILDNLKTEVAFIEAGGGLVRNEKGQYLFIFRHGKWDLPKGKLEPGERPEDGSIREVEEECGIIVRRLSEALEPTWHAYALEADPPNVTRSKLALKKTYWYLMEAGDCSRMKPQAEEGITEVRWFFPHEFAVIRENTYDLIREMLVSGF